MFGVDFSELVVILVVTLVVVGPERLPKVARTLGHLWGRAQRYVNNVKADIARDMAIEEFRQLQQKVQQEADNAQRAVKQVSQSIEHQVQQVNEAVEQPEQAEANKIAAAPPAAIRPESEAPVMQQKLPID